MDADSKREGDAPSDSSASESRTPAERCSGGFVFPETDIMTDADVQLRDYLTMIRDMRKSMPLPSTLRYCGIEDFLLATGRFFIPRILPPTIKPMPLKQCFDNAYKLARRRKGLHYVEGYAQGVIPTMHAWCIDADGHVIDPTWAHDGCALGASYFGVELDLDVVTQTRVTGYTSVLDDWHNDFPVLRGVPVIHPAPFFPVDMPSRP